MITMKYICSRIDRLMEDNETLNREELDTLYKLMFIRAEMEKRAGNKTVEMTDEYDDELDEADMIDENTAKMWVANMEGADGNVGEHWTMDETTSVLKQKGFNIDPIEFYACMNMMYSDFSRVAKRFNVNSADFYASMSDAFLNDKDAKKNKLYLYYEFVVDHKI